MTCSDLCLSVLSDARLPESRSEHWQGEKYGGRRFWDPTMLMEGVILHSTHPLRTRMEWKHGDCQLSLPPEKTVLTLFYAICESLERIVNCRFAVAGLLYEFFNCVLQRH